MKPSLLLSLLLFIPFLTSCGGAGKSSTNLVVTNSALSVANSSFTGGLVIMGKSSKGSFVVPVGLSGTGSSVTVELERDTWTFWAVGWNGAALFEGQAVCDLQTVAIDGDAQSVGLKLTPQNCQNMTSVFGDATYYTGTTFRSLDVITCGRLYSDNVGTVVTPSMTSFCYGPTSNMPSEWIKHAQSIKIGVPSYAEGKVGAGISQCISTGSNGEFPTSKALPTKGLPTTITLYDSTGCPETSKISEYVFSNGIATARPDVFDSVIGAPSSTTNLFLTANDIRRGLNSFMGLIPVIDFGGVPIMPTPSATNLIIQKNTEFVLIDNVTTEQCSNLSFTFTGFVGPSFSNSSNCRIEDNKMLVSIDYTTVGTAITPTGTGFSGAAIFVQESNFHSLFERGFEIFGWKSYPTPSTLVMQSFRPMWQDQDDTDRSSGALSRVREKFLPGGVLSALGNTTCAVGVNPDVIVSGIDKGVLATYRIRVSDITEAAPQYFSSNDPNDITFVTTNFTKRVHLSRLNTSTQIFETEVIMKFSCATQGLGTSEEHHSDSDGVERRRSYWYASPSITMSRFETYSYEEGRDAANIINRIDHSYLRIEKPAVGEVVANKLDYHADRTGLIWKTNANHTQMHVGQSAEVVLLENFISGNSSTDRYELFNNDVYRSLMNKTASDFYASSQSPSGRYVVRAWVDGSCPSRNAHVYIKDRTLFAAGIMSNSFSLPCGGSPIPPRPQVSVNDSGKAIVSMSYADVSEVYKVAVYTYQSGSWMQFTDVSGLASDSSASPLTRVHMFSTGKAVVFWIEGDSTNSRGQVVYYIASNNLSTFNAGGPQVLDHYNTFDADNFGIQIDSNEKLWIFTSSTNADQSNLRVYDNSFTPAASPSSFTNGNHPDYAANEIRSVALVGGGAKFFHKHNALGTETVQPYSGTILVSSIVPLIGTSFTTTEMGASGNALCVSQTTTDYTTASSSCILKSPSFAKPIRSEVNLTLDSLNPSSFSGIFTPAFATVP